MRKYISYLMFAVAAAFFTGCIDVNVTPIEPQEPTMVTLQLTNADLVATRAITDDDQHNEDLIKSVQCFFSVTDLDAVVYATDLIAVNAQQTKKLEFQIPAEHLSTLFANNATQCDVYVLANYGSKLNDTSIASVKAKDITLGTGATQGSFVMDGTAEVKLDGTALSGKVELKRAAAKIVVKANIKTSITEGSVTWTPNIAGIQMSYLGSVKGSKISAESKDAVITEEDTNPYTQTTDVFEGTTTEQLYVGYQTVPFYSFPVEASANKGEIDITIPWNPGNGADVLYKYQVPVDIALERNHVYLIEVIVDVLGNAEGATLTPSYVVVDWTENPITTGLSRPKYLVVDETNVVMNNVNSYSVGYASSDDVTAVIKKVTKPLMTSIPVGVTTIYNNTGSTSVTPGNTISGNKNPFTVSVNNGKIVISHTLINDSSQKSTYDYIPYTIEVEVTNQSGFSETITFVQYPALYVESDLNSGYSATSGDLGHKGYVIINNNTKQTNTWNVVNGLGSGSGSSSSPYMYVVNVTYFDTDDYVIADPRSAVTTNYGFTAQADVNGDRLTQYRPTQTSKDYEDFIAPKFRICSGYGRLGSVDLSAAEARYRCASYQEDGYPAGRWRVPTSAELRFIGKLCAEQKLPPLFSDGVTYWSASAGFTYNRSNGTFTERTSADYVRCVYDEWYWGSERAVDSDEFTWGDDYNN